MGQSPSSKNYTANPADHILVQGNADIENGWVSPRRWTTEVTKTASPGDLIMSVRAPVGAMAKTAYDVVLGRGVAGIKGDEFLYQLLCSLDSSGYWSRVSSGSTFDAISGQELSHTPVTIPSSEEEQESIGQFFKTLDSTFNAAKRKEMLLKLQKQAYLQLMFPRNGEKQPRLRFSEFTDDWKRRQLGDFSQQVKTKNTSTSIRETLTNSAEQGIVAQRDYFDREITNKSNLKGYYIVKPDDFVYNPRVSVLAPVGPINRNLLHVTGIVSPLYLVFSVDSTINHAYLEQYFKTNLWHLFMKIEGNSGARSDRFSISNSTFFKMPIPYPSLREQKQIADFFAKLDSLIAAAESKVEALQRLKQGYMQKMFI